MLEALPPPSSAHTDKILLPACTPGTVFWVLQNTHGLSSCHFLSLSIPTHRQPACHFTLSSVPLGPAWSPVFLMLALVCAGNSSWEGLGKRRAEKLPERYWVFAEDQCTLYVDQCGDMRSTFFWPHNICWAPQMKDPMDCVEKKKNK